MKLEISRHIFQKYSNIKFHENPFSGSRVVPCGWTDGQADMTKLTVVSRNFANAPKRYFTNETVVSSLHVTPSKVIPIGNYTPLHTSLPGLQGDPEVTS
jgi:hypothetical protein